MSKHRGNASMMMNLVLPLVCMRGDLMTFVIMTISEEEVDIMGLNEIDISIETGTETETEIETEIDITTETGTDMAESGNGRGVVIEN